MINLTKSQIKYFLEKKVMKVVILAGGFELDSLNMLKIFLSQW